MDTNWLEFITDHLDVLFGEHTDELSTETLPASKAISCDVYEACMPAVSELYEQGDALVLRAWTRGLFGEPEKPLAATPSCDIPEPYRTALIQYTARKTVLAYADGEATAKAFRHLCE